MPTYKYKTTIKGQVQSGEIEAENEQGAISKLKQRNIAVTSVKKKFESDFLSNKKPITERDIVIFTRQFSTMVDAGLPLVQCLEILGKQADNPAFGDIIIKIKTDIESGNNLSNAMVCIESLYCVFISITYSINKFKSCLLFSAFMVCPKRFIYQKSLYYKYN